MTMQKTTENMVWALGVLQDFGHLPGAPTTDGQWKALVNGLLDIFRSDDEPQTVIDTEEPQRTVDTQGMKKSEWTIAQVHNLAHRFPPLIMFRKVYSKHWKPADGKWANEILAMAEDD
jgi:hypothetical protein